ncbi:MAG TPA: ABC transporter ATP-binding protein, partial [Chitinophagaceae bacterium]
YFMDRLVDHLFVFEGDGVIKDFPGNYSQYRQSIVDSQQSTVDWLEKKLPAKTSTQKQTNNSKRQLTFKEKREFETLEKEIAELTKEKELVDLRLNSGRESFEELEKLSNRIGEIAELLDQKELRWLELSEMVQ